MGDKSPKNINKMKKKADKNTHKHVSQEEPSKESK